MDEQETNQALIIDRQASSSRRVFFLTKVTSCGEVELAALSLDELQLLAENAGKAIEVYKEALLENKEIYQKISI